VKGHYITTDFITNMYKTHVKLQPAEGPTVLSFTSYTGQFKYDAERGNFDTYEMWYAELHKWIDHLTEVDYVELIELQKKLQLKFVLDDKMKAKHRGWKCQRKDNDCEVPIRMRKFMLGLDKEIRKKLKEGLDIPQRSSVIDVVEDLKRKGLVKSLQRFITFCGDIRQNIHHITNFITFYHDNKDVINQSFPPVTVVPDIQDMPLENIEDLNTKAFKKAMELVQSYMAWEMSFLEPAEGRFLSAEPGVHAPLLAHMLFGNPVEYLFTSLLELIGTFARFTAIAIAIFCMIAWLCPALVRGGEPHLPPTRQPPTVNSDMERLVREERADLVEKYKDSPEYTALYKKYYGVIPISELKKLDVNDENNKKKKEETLQKCAKFWDGKCPICLEDMTDANNVKCCNCGHSFHTECVDIWLEKNTTCPNCRKPCGEGLGQAGESLFEELIESGKKSGEKK